MVQKSNATFRVPRGNFEIKIGSDASCEFQASHLPPISAGLKRQDDRLFLKDYKPVADCVLVNSKTLKKKRWTEVSRYDQIAICGSNFNLAPQVFLGRDRVQLDSSKLQLILPNNRIVSEDVFIRAKSGTVTAVMGPSGAGKTVFLEMLNGYNNPTDGRIAINQKLDLHLDYPNIRDYIGYVPQDDIMIPELTVRQSLNYRIRLRYPDMARGMRLQLINKTCDSLGFKGDQLESFLDTVIGSPESGLRGLSGGEKKRANIAHELVLGPLLLILDEPTSGLSSVDTEHIVRMLHELSRDDGLTIIATVHQPSRDAFRYFDDLLLMGIGGKIAYYGRADKAVDYFEKVTHMNHSGRNPPEFLMSFFSDVQKSDQFVKKFKKNSELAKRGNREYHYIYYSSESPQTKPSGKSSGNPTSKKKDSGTVLQNFRQWVVLLQRSCRVLFKDRVNMILMFGQVPIIVALIILAFYNFSSDYVDLDRFSRTVYRFGELKEPLERQNRPVPFRRFFLEASNWAKQNNELISEFGSRNRGAIYFVLVAASIWFGLIGGCKEIVTEKHIIRRELRSCVNLRPLLLSKITLLAFTVGCLTAVLTAMVAPLLLKLAPLSMVMLWLVLWLASFTSASMGLCVSCFSPTYRFALTAVPLLLIPQLVFGGMIRPLANLENVTIWPQIAGGMTIQRWAFEASLGVDKFGRAGVLKQEIQQDLGKIRKYDEMNVIQYTESSLMKTFFRSKWREPFAFPLACLAFFNIIFLLACYWRLRRVFAL